jgi:hypothetical protein
MTLDRKSIKEGDTIWTVFTGCDGGGPFARVCGGDVVATDKNGSITYRDGRGSLETTHNWGIYTLHPTQAEAWEAAAERLQRLADQVAAKANECRAKAGGEVAA